MPAGICRTCKTAPITRYSKTGECAACSQQTQSFERRKAPTAIPSAREGISVKGDAAEVSKVVYKPIHTLAELIRVCEVDTTEWEVERYTCMGQQQVSVPRSTGSKQEGWRRESAEPVLRQMFHVKAWLKRKTPLVKSLERARVELVKDLRAAAPKPKAVKHRFPQGGWLFEFCPFDLHLGKLAWSDETVTNYDTAIAEDLFKASLEFLLDRALKLSDGKLERILCVFGNDAAHIDSKKAETTAGTRMDADSRYLRVFRRLVAIHREAVDRLVEVAPVDIVIVPGNHDEQTAFLMGAVLEALYEKHPHVTIDNNPKLRKYYRFGTNLFGFTHGDSEKVSELPLTMAREVPELWSQAASREWHIGHKHISEKFETRGGRMEQDFFSDKGVRVRRLTSLSAHDFWHTRHAYMDRRACEGFVFHKTAGFTDHLSFNVDHFTGQALTIK
jgi:hypothetical protein